jgi:hypothetical protein
VLRHAWSLRLNALAAALTATEFILPVFMDDPSMGRGWFAVLGFAVSTAARAARFVAQRKVRAWR